MNTDSFYATLGVDTLVDEIPGIEEKIKQVYDRIFQGLTEYCEIPQAFRHCRLETREIEIRNLSEEGYMNLINNPSGAIINPQPPHREAIKFFKLLLEGNEEICEDSDPLRPQIGAYLHGLLYKNP